MEEAASIRLPQRPNAVAAKFPRNFRSDWPENRLHQLVPNSVCSEQIYFLRRICAAIDPI
jgi:hypothetical protein